METSNPTPTPTRSGQTKPDCPPSDNATTIPPGELSLVVSGVAVGLTLGFALGALLGARLAGDR